MILLLGGPQEPMIEAVLEVLERRRSEVVHIDPATIPGQWRLDFTVGRPALRHRDGAIIDLQEVQAVYHRLGFGNFETLPDFQPEETTYVTQACMAAFNPVLDALPALVVNRPRTATSNASKPLQALLLQDAGFGVAETIVTNVPEQVQAFLERHGGNVIYKSISHLRSIVQVMTEEDLQRLDTLQACPAQFQERVEGTDVRVHVVGERVFASIIHTEQSDYRYDKKVDIQAVELEPWLSQACVSLARQLGMVLTGIDLRLTPEGRAVCFEANPSPVFTWYEQRTGQPIAEALATLLQTGS